MGEPDETARMIALRLPHSVVDQAAHGKVGLIEAGPAGQHCHVNAGMVHHPHMRGKIGQQWIEGIVGIAVLVEANRSLPRPALHQFGRRVVMLEVDDHAHGPSIAAANIVKSREPSFTMAKLTSWTGRAA